MNRSICCFTLLLAFGVCANANAQMFGDTTGSDATTADDDHTPGTSGDGVPDLFYNPNTGVLTLDTDGQPIKTLKVTTPDPFMTAGASLLDGGSEFGVSNGRSDIWPTADTGTGNSQFYNGSDGVARFWISTYVDANGTTQWSLDTDSSNTGMIGVFDIAQFPTGLDLTSFGTPANTDTPQGVELGEFVSGPATTYFTEVTTIPEPNSSFLFFLGCLAIGLRRRR